MLDLTITRRGVLTRALAVGAVAFPMINRGSFAFAAARSASSRLTIAAMSPSAEDASPEPAALGGRPGPRFIAGPEFVPDFNAEDGAFSAMVVRR